jgi:hypothetical protein
MIEVFCLRFGGLTSKVSSGLLMSPAVTIKHFVEVVRVFRSHFRTGHGHF